jgi:alpha-amylase
MLKKLMLFIVFSAFVIMGITSCTSCDMSASTQPEEEPATYVNVTFRVDMSAEEVDPNGVHVAGDFGDNSEGVAWPAWDPSSDLMMLTEGDAGVYEITLEVAVNTTYEFKYANGNGWYGEEWAGGSNRTAVVGEEDLILDLVVFGVQP